MAFKHSADADTDDAGKVEITGRIIAESEKAVKIDDGIGAKWLPRSKISIRPADRNSEFVEVLMPEWLARKLRYV